MFSVAKRHDTSRFVPPLEAVEPLIDRSEAHILGHLWWEGKFNTEKQAILSWAPHNYPRRHPFVVIRLLEEAQRGLLPLGASLINQCGWSACLCVDHWKRVTVKEKRLARRPAVVTETADGRLVMRSVHDIHADAVRRR